MTAIQIVLICFSVFASVKVLVRFRRGGLHFLHFFLWLLFWAAVVVVAIHPATTSRVAEWLGVGRGADVAMYLALVTVFYLLFRTFGKVEDLERQITRVVRAAALKDLDESLEKSKPKPP
jgi:small membrane protein